MVAKKKEEDELADKRKTEEKSLEAKLTQEEKKQEDLPATKQRSSVSRDGKISEMRGKQRKMKKDALRTPASLRKIRKNVRPTATSSSPSLK